MEKSTSQKEQLNEIYQKFKNGNISTTAEVVHGVRGWTQEFFAHGCLGGGVLIPEDVEAV